MKYKQLTSEQRSQISALLQSKAPRKEIAEIVGISQSTLSRELKRNSCRNGRHYSWRKAHEMAMERRERICTNRKIPSWVMNKAIKLLTREQWSPEQISASLRTEGITISHESIYAYVRLRPELWPYCRHKLKYRLIKSSLKRLRQQTYQTAYPSANALRKRTACGSAIGSSI